MKRTTAPRYGRRWGNLCSYIKGLTSPPLRAKPEETPPLTRELVIEYLLPGLTSPPLRAKPEETPPLTRELVIEYLLPGLTSPPLRAKPEETPPLTRELVTKYRSNRSYRTIFRSSRSALLLLHDLRMFTDSFAVHYIRYTIYYSLFLPPLIASFNAARASSRVESRIGKGQSPG
ncbi:MAG: hypothetical protein A4E64_00030 [Syntrophorhabdus sp. PtaU1.Bin058]|nr:MAG: hypothetical protein A4E64_00030 [Syntrophorhabdus sp. PtaU1.Bin058]